MMGESVNTERAILYPPYINDSELLKFRFNDVQLEKLKQSLFNTRSVTPSRIHNYTKIEINGWARCVEVLLHCGRCGAIRFREYVWYESQYYNGWNTRRNHWLLKPILGFCQSPYERDYVSHAKCPSCSHHHLSFNPSCDCLCHQPAIDREELSLNELFEHKKRRVLSIFTYLAENGGSVEVKDWLYEIYQKSMPLIEMMVLKPSSMMVPYEGFKEKTPSEMLLKCALCGLFIDAGKYEEHLNQHRMGTRMKMWDVLMGQKDLQLLSEKLEQEARAKIEWVKV